MSNLNRARWDAGFWQLLGLLLAISIYRTLVIQGSGLCLYVDEAQYWTWAKRLDWGYFSKPPVIAALIAMTTALFGNGELAVKSGALIVYPIVAGLIWAIARRLFGSRIAFWSALAFITLPGVSFSSMIISTDVPLFLFWTLALYAYQQAIAKDRLRWWLLAGLASGLGLLTKYTMLIFAVSVVLHLATTPSLRPKLREPGVYAAMLVAVIVFMPNLWWNAQHGWPTLHHTSQISGLGSEAPKSIAQHGHELLAFLGGQFALLGPVLLVAWILQLTFGWPGWMVDARYRLLACFSLPFLAVIAAQALLGRANANWAAMTYAAATIFVVARLVETTRIRWLYAAIALNVAAMLVAYHFDTIARISGIEMTRRTDLYKRVRGWPELGSQAAGVMQSQPQALMLADDREVLAELEYYVCLSSHAEPVHAPFSAHACLHPLDAVEWNPKAVIDSHYALTTTMQDKRGKDFFYFTRRDDLPQETLRSFKSAQKLAPLHVRVDEDYALDLNVWWLSDFGGYR